MRYLKNLSSSATFEGNPWDFNDRNVIPKGLIEDKVARIEWANLPTTDFCFYSGFVGINPNGRVSEAGGKENANSPREMTCFVGDYDAKFTEQEIESAIARMEIKPNWVERSLSGNWRLIWLFERPIVFSSRNFACFLLKSLHEFLPIRELSNLDSGYMEPSRYYQNGCQWRQIHPTPVPWGAICGFLLPLVRSYNWKDNEPGVSIPYPVVADRLRELSDKYPRFKDWEGDFAEGAQGPTFWVEGSTSATSAVVQCNGMYSFSHHARQTGKVKWTWAELLGAEWVKQFEQNRIGNAIKDIYFDGKDYGVKRDEGRWDTLNKDNVINELIVRRGLTRDISKKKGETFSEVEGALAHIHSENRVKGMASFAFTHPKGPITFNGHRYLNTHTIDAMQPADSPAVWGPEGQFPWISKFYDGLFTSPDQLPYYLSWASYFYKGCHYRKLTLGHVLYIAGPTACGKTFSCRYIIGAIVGGVAEASSYLLKETTFNSHLFEKAMHCVDDTAVTSNEYLTRLFCEAVKRAAANNDRECNEKFRVSGGAIACRARISVTSNMDSDSQNYPDLDASMKDKAMMFQAKLPDEPFPEFSETEAILARELPWFCRYLLDYVVPEQCRGTTQDEMRFGGIKAYHNPDMVLSAQQTSKTSGLAQILYVWMGDYFVKTNPDADVWRGTPIELYQQFSQVPGISDILRQTNFNKFNRDIRTLSLGSQFKIKMVTGTTGIVIYEIDRSTHYPKNVTVLEVPAQRTDSRFQKPNENV